MKVLSNRTPLIRRTALWSAAVHGMLILVPGALWQNLAGHPDAVPAPGDAFTVSLYPVPPVAPGPAENPDPPDRLDQPDQPVQPEESAPVETSDPIETPSAPKPGVKSVSRGAHTANPAAPGGDPGPGDRGDPARYQPPRLLAGALPIDPEDSGELQVPDEIPVRLRVGKSGNVIEIIPADPDLSAPILAALEKSARAMRFAPARMGKTPVEAWFSMTFIYRR